MSPEKMGRSGRASRSTAEKAGDGPPGLRGGWRLVSFSGDGEHRPQWQRLTQVLSEGWLPMHAAGLGVECSRSSRVSQPHEWTRSKRAAISQGAGTMEPPVVFCVPQRLTASGAFAPT